MMMGRWTHSQLTACLANLAVAYVVMMLSRLIFVAENWATFVPYMSWPLAASMLRGALVFDTSALLYVNSLYLMLTLLPLHHKECAAFYRAMRWVYVVPNALAVGSNLVDAVFFQYTGRRTTVTVFSEFANESNLTAIIMTETLRHWYLVLAFAVLVVVLWRAYSRPSPALAGRRLWRYYALQTLSLLVLTPLAIVGIRGSATAGTRPITISNANQYVNRPVEGTVVLNTPFSIIRSIGKKAFVNPHYMSQQEMERIFRPIVQITPDSLSRGGRNVVILIVESMSKEYVGALNSTLDDGYDSLMPFVDRLVGQSLTWQYSYANGRISMDAMPSILAGLPMMVEPFFLTPASLNDVQGISALLAAEGYQTAFFHGGHNISMGFSAFAHSIGFERYYGLDEYCQSPKYGGMDDFDGKWAIWDEPFLQFMLDQVSTMRQPFMVSAFTASSHHPYNVPKQYRDSLTDIDGRQPIDKCVRYTDLALRRFFERASRQPWYANTVFVLVADHTNLASHAEYLTDLGRYSIPIIIFTPDGSLQPGVRTDAIAQQVDITPTVMHLLGYTKPFVSFGSDLLGTPPEKTWAMNYNNGVYQYLRGDLMIQFDGQQTVAAYRFKTDPLLRHNLVRQVDVSDMQHTLQAIIQQYMWRMNENRLVIR